jgi:hypothetical protein
MAGTGRDDQWQFYLGEIERTTLENRKDDFGKSKGRLWKIERTISGNRKDDFGKSKGRLWEIERTILRNRKDDFKLAAMEEFINQKNEYVQLSVSK